MINSNKKFDNLFTNQQAKIGLFLVGVLSISGYILGAFLGSFFDIYFSQLSQQISYYFLGIPVITFLFSFFGLIFGMWISAKLILKTSIFELIFTNKINTFGTKLNLKTSGIIFFKFAFFWFLISIFTDLILYFFSLTQNLFWFNFQGFSPNIFFYLIFFGLFFLIQTFAEELFFRGWLPIFLKAFKLPTWLIAIIASVFFSAIHFSNPEAQKYGLFYFCLLFCFSLFLFFVMKKTKGIQSAWGVHFANNFYVFFVVSYPSSAIQTNSIWITNHSVILISSGLTLVLAAIYFLIHHLFLKITHKNLP